MNKSISKKGRIYSNIIITASITGVIFFSLTPLIYENITPDSPHFILSVTPYYLQSVLDDLENASLVYYHNHIGMGYSYNKDIIDLTNISSQIIICFWLIIILGIIAFIGIMLYTTDKLLKLPKKLIIIGGSTIFFGIIILYFYWNFLSAVNGINDVSLASMVNVNFPIKYIYLPLIMSFISLIGSVLYTKNIFDMMKIDKEVIKDDRESKIISKHPRTIKADSSTLKSAGFEKQSGFSENKDYKFKLNRPVEIQSEILQQESKSSHTEYKDDSIRIDPFANKEPKVRENNEKSFSIEDRMAKSNQEKVITSNIKKDLNKKKFRIRCPKCNSEFIIEKDIGEIQIVCPYCGKEGILK
jgi:hypothetical protein